MLASVDGESVACMHPPSGSKATAKIAIESFGTAGPPIADSSAPSRSRCCPNRAENMAARNTWPCSAGRVPSPQTAEERRSVSIASPCFGQTRLDSCALGLGMGSPQPIGSRQCGRSGFKGAAMLATLNSRQIVDAIVKDTMKDNDPHDAVQISPDVVLASRTGSDAPTLAPDIASRPEPKIDVAPKAPATAAPSVDTAIRVTAHDMPGREKRSAVGKWLRGAFFTMLVAGGSAAATIAWESHGDTARQMLAEWTPSLMSLVPSTSPATPGATAQAAPPAPEAATDQTTDQAAAPAAVQDAAAAPAVTQSDATQSLQSMTRDVAAMAQQIAQLKANVAELKTAQEQMAREMVKPPAPKPVADAKPIDPRARVSALPPRPPVAPMRKPKPITTPAYTQTYAPTQIAPPPPPSQAVAVPPPPAAATQAVADDDGPVVRPPMPVH